MDKINKFLSKLSKTQRKLFLKILLDIQTLNLNFYDVKPLKGAKGYFRLRKGNARIIFVKDNGQGYVSDIALRKDVYKNL